jgi:heme/copper-type cytochrome/quinol oxidase subunit 1
MATSSVPEGAALVRPIESTRVASIGGTNRLITSHIGVSVAAFGIAAAMAMMQAISRANLELPYRSAQMYYMSVTAHGVLMALVFTTFFIMALGYAVVKKENGDIRWPGLAWVSFWTAVLRSRPRCSTRSIRRCRHTRRSTSVSRWW